MIFPAFPATTRQAAFRARSYSSEHENKTIQKKCCTRFYIILLIFLKKLLNSCFKKTKSNYQNFTIIKNKARTFMHNSWKAQLCYSKWNKHVNQITLWKNYSIKLSLYSFFLLFQKFASEKITLSQQQYTALYIYFQLQS